MTHDSRCPALVVVGSLNMDLVMRVSRIPAAGETLTARDFTFAPGGKGANQAVACARLGAPTAMVGLVGGDAFGAALRASLQRDGVNAGHVAAAADATGVAVILVDDAAENRIALAPGANAALTPAHIADAAPLIGEAALLLLQLEVPLATVIHTVERALAAGCPILLNPAPAQPLPDALLPHIDYLVTNETEAALLTGTPVNDVEAAAHAAGVLRRRGVRHALVTLGERGVVIADDTGVYHFAAPAVDAVDTTAAGDTFIGGLATGLYENLALEHAVRLGIEAAALCVTRRGAQAAIPFRRELQGIRAEHRKISD